MKKISWLDLAALVIFLLPIAYFLFSYSSLPPSVPVHFGVNGNANRYETKSGFAIFEGIMFCGEILIYLLVRFLPAIDPKNKAKYSEAAFKKIAFGVVIFLSALNTIIIFAAINGGVRMAELLFLLIGLLFVFFGNIINNIKPNYFVGIRTPWTLESEDTWRATHRLAGKVWFAGGIVLTLLAILLPASTAYVVLIGGIICLVTVPVIYSYFYFKKHQIR